MTLPRSTYRGGYYSSPSFPDTPIYDSLVAERGTPQIAPIRVPAAYDSSGHLPALPAARPALPAGPSQHTPHPSYTAHTPAPGYPAAPQPTPLQQAPTPYIPQQQMRPAAPRQMPGAYDDPYGRQHPGGHY